MSASLFLRREDHVRQVRVLLDEFPVVAVLGAQQVGKTTLARHIADAEKKGATWFDLEDPADLARLEDPVLALRDLCGLIVLDEIQRLPDVLPLLRDLANRPGPPTRFLLLGSTSPELLRQTSEPLPRRIAFHQLVGFGLDEVTDFERLWLRGGLPRSYLAASDDDAARWRRDSSTRSCGSSFRTSARQYPRQRFGASGPGWRARTAKSGTKRNSRAHWGFPKQR